MMERKRASENSGSCSISRLSGRRPTASRARSQEPSPSRSATSCAVGGQAPSPSSSLRRLSGGSRRKSLYSARVTLVCGYCVRKRRVAPILP